MKIITETIINQIYIFSTCLSLKINYLFQAFSSRLFHNLNKLRLNFNHIYYIIIHNSVSSVLMNTHKTHTRNTNFKLQVLNVFICKRK